MGLAVFFFGCDAYLYYTLDKNILVKVYCQLLQLSPFASFLLFAPLRKGIDFQLEISRHYHRVTVFVLYHSYRTSDLYQYRGGHRSSDVPSYPAFSVLGKIRRAKAVASRTGQKVFFQAACIG